MTTRHFQVICATVSYVACVAQNLPQNNGVQDLPPQSLPPQDVARGSIQGSSSNHVTIRPLCHPTEMHVYIEFAGNSFKDWIVLGTNGIPDCLTHGDGGTKYLLRIHLRDDACGTHMVAPGIFENVVSIRTHPRLNLILENDEQVTVRCTYGPPTVNSLPIPDFPATEARIPQPTVLSPGRDPSRSTPAPARISNGLIVLVVFLVLILAILFLLCGCCYYFFRRRSVRVTRKNKLLLAVPAGVQQDKQGMWWGTNKTTLSNDALLSHDYMVSSNSTRDPLSVSTGGEYANDTPSTGSDSNGSPAAAGNGATNEVFVHESRHMIPRVHAESSSARAIQSLQSIPEENVESLDRSDTLQSAIYKSWQRKMDKGRGGVTPSPRPGTSTGGAGIHFSPGTSSRGGPHGKGSNSTSDHHQGEDYPDGHGVGVQTSRAPKGAMYAQVDKGQNRPQQQQPHHSRDNVVDRIRTRQPQKASMSGGVGGSRYASEMRSMSEIYTLPPPDRIIPTDTVSVSTLEGIQYLRPQDVVEVDPVTLQQQFEHRASSNRGSTFEEMAQDRSMDEQTNIEPFIAAVEEHRGNGPRKLTNEEIDRWRTRLANDARLQAMVCAGKTLEDFELISHHPIYEGLFPHEKWAIIAQSLSHVTFMQKLNDIIDNTPNNFNQHGHLQQNKQSTATSRTTGHPHGSHSQNHPAKRIFTRDSYNKVKSDIESLSGDESLYDNQTTSGNAGVLSHLDSTIESSNDRTRKLTRDRSTTEITEQYPMTDSPDNSSHPQSPPPRVDMAENLQSAVMSTLTRQKQGILNRDKSNGHILDTVPPTLNVYMGNVPERSLQESVAPDRMPARDSFYNALPGSSLSDLYLNPAASTTEGRSNNGRMM